MRPLINWDLYLKQRPVTNIWILCPTVIQNTPGSSHWDNHIESSSHYIPRELDTSLCYPRLCIDLQWSKVRQQILRDVMTFLRALKAEEHCLSSTKNGQVERYNCTLVDHCVNVFLGIEKTRISTYSADLFI